MELYNRKIELKGHEDGSCKHVSMRGSIIVFIMKLLTLLLLFELTYLGVYYIFTLGIPLPLDLHHHAMLSLFFLAILKILTQAYIILHVTLDWANNAYYIEGKHLIKNSGIINIEEESYDLTTVRSVIVNQSWLGRIFHYGDVTLKTSASGGYQVIVTMGGIQNPQDHERMIKQCL